jgi:hypothetical protein
MAEVVYLKRGEKPPKRKSSSFLLVVCRRRGGEVAEIGADGALKTIRTSPEQIAESLHSLLGSHPKIYVRGVPTKADAEAKAKTARGCKRWPRPTIEDLQRENEINGAIGGKLRSTVQALIQLDATSRSDVSGCVVGIITDYLAAAPGDDYGQRRALEMLNRATPELASGGVVQRSVMRIVLPSLLDAWKRDR